MVSLSCLGWHRTHCSTGRLWTFSSASVSQASGLTDVRYRPRSLSLSFLLPSLSLLDSFLFFRDRISLCSSHWSWKSDFYTPASWGLELQACDTPTSLQFVIRFEDMRLKEEKKGNSWLSYNLLDTRNNSFLNRSFFSFRVCVCCVYACLHVCVCPCMCGSQELTYTGYLPLFTFYALK